MFKVNSEHEKNLSNDEWRIKQVHRHLAKDGHAYKKFGSGSKATLFEIPKQQGIDVRDELLKFHKDWYSANIMSLAIIGKGIPLILYYNFKRLCIQFILIFDKDSLDDLEKMVLEKFSEIENKNVERPRWPREPYADDQYGQKVVIVPIKDVRSLIISFTSDDLTEFYKTAVYRPNDVKC